MTKPPSIAEALEEPTMPNLGHGRIVKNLHWIIGAVVVAVLAAILLSEAFNAENKNKQNADEARRLERIKAAAIDQKPEDIGEILAKQKKKGEEEAKPVIPDSLALPPLPAGVPKGAQGYQGMNPPAAPQVDQEAKEEAKAAKSRDQASRAANILAIDTGYREQTSGKSSYIENANSQVMVADGTQKTSRRDAAMAELQQNQKEIQALQNRINTQKEQVRASGGMGGGSDSMGMDQGSTMRSNGGAGSTSDSKWMASQAVPNDGSVLTAKAAASPYIVLQGTVIPAVLISEINSDLPGSLTAQVTIDVYDSIRGDHLLIPKGSRLIGQYNNDLRLGQERVMAAFRRIILPNGTYVDLQGMGISDAQGQSGVTGDVNNHFWKMFGPSLFSASLAWLFQRNEGSTTVVVNTGSSQGQTYQSAAGQILVDTTKKITDRAGNLQPTITIQQGYRFNIIASRDIVLNPYSRNSRN